MTVRGRRRWAYAFISHPTSLGSIQDLFFGDSELKACSLPAAALHRLLLIVRGAVSMPIPVPRASQTPPRVSTCLSFRIRILRRTHVQPSFARQPRGPGIVRQHNTVIAHVKSAPNLDPLVRRQCRDFLGVTIQALTTPPVKLCQRALGPRIIYFAACIFHWYPLSASLFGHHLQYPRLWFACVSYFAITCTTVYS
jgi:hypothetical protein